jgi:hypothetical protein
MMSRRILAAVAAISFHLASSGHAAAQTAGDRAQARELGEMGYAALEAKDYARAAELFARAEALYHAPTLLLGLARAEAHLGRFVESWEHYHRVVLEGAPAGAPKAIRESIDSAKQEMDAVAAHRARLTLHVKGATASSVTLDGAQIPPAALGTQRLVNPGAHVVHVSAQGAEQDKRFEIADGGELQVTIDLGAPPSAPLSTSTPTPATTGTATAPGPEQPSAPPKSSRKTLAWIGIAGGGAGIVTGLVTGGIAMSKRSSAASNPCASSPCAASDLSTYNSDRDAFHSMGTISTIAFIAGGVLGTAGVYLLVTSPKEAPPTSAWVAPYVSPTAAGITGAF